VLLSSPDYLFLEDAGTVDIEVLREGSDLSHTTVVWCATRLTHPPSATPGVDYAPSSSQITFLPGQTAQVSVACLFGYCFTPTDTEAY
jgi:hypothetical protein